MWKKERPGAERFVIGTSGSVMVTALSHQGWGMMKQNVQRALGSQGQPGLVAAGSGSLLGGSSRNLNLGFQQLQLAPEQ